MVPETFRNWACSLSGCDGGNPSARIWISGIEWGGGSSEDGTYYQDKLPAEIQKGAYPGRAIHYDWKEHLTYRYGISFAKLFSALNGVEPARYKEYVSSLGRDEVFKLNLYPIAFDSTDGSLWKQNRLEELTGFAEKHLFQTWCFYNRFPVFSQLVRSHKPKIVIGTGVTYLPEYFACFGGDQDSSARIVSADVVHERVGKKAITRRIYWAPINNDTTLFVIPFFSGQHGLNSDYLLGEVGKKIREVTL